MNRLIDAEHAERLLALTLRRLHAPTGTQTEGLKALRAMAHDGGVQTSRGLLTCRMGYWRLDDQATSPNYRVFVYQPQPGAARRVVHGRTRASLVRALINVGADACEADKQAARVWNRREDPALTELR